MFRGIGGPARHIMLNGISFPPTKDADLSIKIGGMAENEVESNGDGTGRLLKSIETWSVEGIVVSCDIAGGDFETLNELASLNSAFDVAVELVDGSVYQGEGQITGGITFSSQKTTAAFTLMGGGKLTRQ